MSATKLPPSPAKLRKLQKDGVFAISPLLTKEFAQATFVAGIIFGVGAVSMELSDLLLSHITMIWHAQFLPLSFAFETISLFAFSAIAALVVAASLSIVVRAWRVSVPKPSLSGLKPFSGFTQRFQRDGITTLAIKVATAFISVFLAFTLIRSGIGSLESGDLGSPPSLDVALVTLLLVGSIAGVVGAIVDQVFRKRSFLDKHGMAPHEAKQEHREQEGSPEIKSAQHQARMELMYAPPAKAMLAADVVIRNPTHIAVVITGVRTESPWILMSGQGERARELLRLARRYDRPSVRSVQLARQLHQCGEGVDVPAQLIRAVTEAARWAHELRNQSSR